MCHSNYETGGLLASLLPLCVLQQRPISGDGCPATTMRLLALKHIPCVCVMMGDPNGKRHLLLIVEKEAV